MTQEILENLKTDLELLMRDKFHTKHEDLINMVFLEDIPELIKFVERVNKALETELPLATGDQYRGFKCAVETLKRELYGK
jgi:hypothetical protein